ncbi:MAG: hypothetical protein ABII12_03305 [Planctomycetota bacterium]
MTQQQEDMLDEILATESGMTGREMDFIEDMDARWRTRALSEKQADWLIAIWTKVCA